MQQGSNVYYFKVVRTVVIVIISKYKAGLLTVLLIPSHGFSFLYESKPIP
jgi:hypothetical protein